jgi:hypothetical protein
LLEGLVVVQQPVQLRVQFDVDLAQQTSSDNLPNQTQDQMLSHFDDVSAANVDDRAADTLGRLDDDVVVLGEVEVVQRLDLLARLVQHTLVDGVGHAVVDELGEHEPVLALVEHLERVRGERQTVANVGVAREDGIDVARKLGALVFVDGVRDVRGGALDLDAASTAADAGLLRVSQLPRRGRRAAGAAGASARAGWACVHALLGGRGFAQLRDELSPSVPASSCGFRLPYINIVVQLDSPRAVEFDLLQRLSHHIVRLVLRLLRRLDDGALVEVALVVDVEPAEGVLQAKDLALLELRVFPARNASLAAVEARGGAWKTPKTPTSAA